MPYKIFAVIESDHDRALNLFVFDRPGHAIYESDMTRRPATMVERVIRLWAGDVTGADLEIWKLQDAARGAASSDPQQSWYAAKIYLDDISHPVDIVADQNGIYPACWGITAQTALVELKAWKAAQQ